MRRVLVDICVEVYADIKEGARASADFLRVSTCNTKHTSNCPSGAQFVILCYVHCMYFASWYATLNCANLNHSNSNKILNQIEGIFDQIQFLSFCLKISLFSVVLMSLGRYCV